MFLTNVFHPFAPGCYCTRWNSAGGYFASIPGWDLDTSPPTGHQQFYSRESWFQTGTNRNPGAICCLTYIWFYHWNLIKHLHIVCVSLCACGWMWLWMLQVFEGGWGCKTELALSGCHICTSIREHRELVDDMCRHIKGMLLDWYVFSIGSLNIHIAAILPFYSNKHTLTCVHVRVFMCMHASAKSGGRLACWDCPTAFPVFIQHPYSPPVCLATGSYQEQTCWANILRAVTQHQSSGIVLLSLFPVSFHTHQCFIF